MNNANNNGVNTQQSTFADSIAGKPRSAAHNKSFLALTMAFCLVTCSLYSHVTIWILLIGLIAVIMRFLLYLGLYQHVPGTRIINILGIVSGALLVVMSQDMTMLRTMINLLIMASALKIMVLHTQKDLLFIFISVLFLAALGLIIHFEFIFTVFYSALVVVLLATLASHFAPSRPLRQSLSKTLWLLVQSLPIALIMYFLVPHFAPFWQVPAPKQETTGLTDIVKPGNIADLAQSADLAMIVKFNQGEIPKFHQRYWRALVIDEFDGESWSQSQLQQAYQQPLLAPIQPQQHLISQSSNDIQFTQYESILMANQTQYVPTLNAIIDIKSDGPTSSHQRNLYHITASNHVINAQPQVFTTNYSAMSMLNANHQRRLSEPETAQYLQLPKVSQQQVPSTFNPRLNPKTQAWVKQLSKNNPSLAQFIVAFNRFLLDENFTYTLQPPLMQENMVDQFLFTHQTGFCSHYASAMAYALRLAGYPTRLVAGYQGGEQVNESTLMIYQYDAHAWLEVYDSSLGWQRLDPTAVIAPTRISDGLAQALTNQDEYLAQDMFSLAKYNHIPGVEQLHQLLQQGAVMWHGSFRSFDNSDKQDLVKALMQQFSITHPMWLGLGGLALISLCLASYFIYGNTRQVAQSEHIKWYLMSRQWCVGRYVKGATESASDIQHYPPEKFLSWLITHASDEIIAEMQQITTWFIQHEYQAGSEEKENSGKHLIAKQIKSSYKTLKRIT